MAPSPGSDVWITGIGLLSSLGEGTATHAAAARDGVEPNVDAETFAPYPVHPLVEPDWAAQITRRDKRQMEPWQQIGTYAAGLALDDAGAKDEANELVSRMDMIVAAGGGERDIEVDEAITRLAREGGDVEAMMAERLSSDLRPTLFLAQLSNLLAGNISIVHKVTGSSRTFMGEEGAGIAAVSTAHARIAAGQSDIVLVGGAFNAQRLDMILSFELGGHLLKGDWAKVRERAGDGGAVLGSLGAFLVLESADHARARGARAHARLAAVAQDYGRAEQRKARIETALGALGASDIATLVSGASGGAAATRDEFDALNAHVDASAIVTIGDLVGHGVEAQFPAAVAIAALLAKDGPALATTVGLWRSEGLALVEPSEG